MRPLELWGGIECTLNRIGDEYMDQCQKNGHYDRPSDFYLFKEIGIKKIRYPCLWEHVSPMRADLRDWSKLDRNLDEIKKLGITPIAGFLHHGSGPKFTNLLDLEFPDLFAQYARDFALRYPWIKNFTPINEILTTSRFSCLYGHWFPHHKNNHSFLKAVFLQCKATVLAMNEIKKIIPDAKLIQTEDIGKCQSTEQLKYQCDFENERRWLAFDILCGKLNNQHPQYDFIISQGISSEEIIWTQNNFCVPDILGINHYLLSNRYLDHQLDKYPQEYHGGNGVDCYADVGVLDTGQADLPDAIEIMSETWERFNLPIVITEVHARGYREEQMRWLYQMWNAAKTAKIKGIDVLAITSWSLLGTYDWNSLCTRNDYFYESGVFDLRSRDSLPRKTGLTKLVKELALTGDSASAILETKGIWNSSRRILFAAKIGSFSPLVKAKRPLIISGATGTLGRAFAKICSMRNIPYILLNRIEMDISNIASIRKVMSEYKPWAFINAAGYVKVDEAESERDLCFRDNVDGPINLAIVCKEESIPFLTFSSDLVFDGEQVTPYKESDRVSPLNIYGMSKAICEERVLSIYPDSLIIRSSAFFGPWDNYNFVFKTIMKLKNNLDIFVANDCTVSPTYLPDMVNAALDLLIDAETGIIHLNNKGNISWATFANSIAEKSMTRFNFIKPKIIEQRLDEISFIAKRPKNSSLESSRGYDLPGWEDALNRYFVQIQ